MTAMAQSRRMSESYLGSSWVTAERTPIANIPANSQECVNHWHSIFARDLIDLRIVTVDAQTSVEEACETLLTEDILCLTVKSDGATVGLFDFSDVNAFLTLAATRHTLPPDDLRENHRVHEIVAAARTGHVPVQLVSNLSEKNPLVVLPYDATIVSLLKHFSRGTHKVLVQKAEPPNDYLGIVSDRRLLAWFSSYASQNPSLGGFLSNPLHSFSLPSLDLYSSVIAATSTASVLDAMRLMSEEGVSSVAVVDDQTAVLLSAVSVTDVGKIVVPSESKHILSIPLHKFIAQIKASDGSKDGADKYPVYSVLPTNSMLYTIQKLLATNAHRLFVTQDSSSGVSSPVVSYITSGNLSGIVSIVDILSIFGRMANIEDVDPKLMQRHRRASSSASSHSSLSDELSRSRPSSRTSVRRTLSLRNPRAMNRNSRASFSSAESATHAMERSA
ncbi:uncharacterized protein BT62DRAFT_985826 [Guyanagaster necrorhizus]|uniref:CBS domain-containing protein n=1 Tax=Guyanagaster necrorhizus TaxID=856835 RepID=A0A9P7VY03_9AGAR|nr:uncharacterized protein BT62DRAFT_985826 [Guyanagaster necrorhizus MCA 3950]KAG7448530.1 hypothetical protein BT62DRAFT_985826 [Guyanagaster necrorhizus MCA 3950]